MNEYNQNLKILYERIVELNELQTIEHPNIITDYIAQFKKGGIYIKPENRGKFTKSAKSAGKSVQAHAHDVVNNPNSTEKQRKRAQFAINAKKWSHKKKK